MTGSAGLKQEALPTWVQRRYRVLGPLGAGGMGTTFRVYDELKRREAALKVLARMDSASEAIFRSEFSVLRDLVHPHLVRVFDFGRLRLESGETTMFYTAALIEGQPFDTYAAGRPWADLQKSVMHVLDALGFLHRFGMLHGDVKPENVIVTEDGDAHVIDFGCSVPLTTSALSGTGPTAVWGTPGFMAPEVASCVSVDARSDLFSFGVTLREVTSRSSGELPSRVTSLIARLTDPSPTGRPNDVKDVLEFLESRRDVETARAPLGRCVGREVALGEFMQLVRCVTSRASGTRVLWLHGEEGVGRSRLLQEMKWDAQLECVVVEGDARSPTCLADILRAIAGNASAPSTVQGLWQMRRHASEPTVVILDDVHLLDAAQRRLFEALIRGIRSDDPWLWVVTSNSPSESMRFPTVSTLAVEPIGEDAVASWVGGSIPSTRLPAFMRQTRGFPADIQAALERPSTNAEGRSGRARDGAAADPRAAYVETRLRELDASGKRALGIAVVLDGVVPDWVRRAFSQGFDWSALVELGWLERVEKALRFCRPSYVAYVKSAFSERELRQHAALAADVWKQRRDLRDRKLASRHRAISCQLLLRAGRDEEAASLFVDCREDLQFAPQDWQSVCDAFASQRSDEAFLLHLAFAFVILGKAQDALRLVLRARRRCATADLHALYHIAGASYLLLGSVHRALVWTLRATTMAPKTGRDSSLELLARVHLRRGAYSEARRVAAEASLEASSTPALQASLFQLAGIAASYQGDFVEADRLLERAVDLHQELDDPRSRYRSLSYRALNLYRQGAPRAALDLYREAVEVAEFYEVLEQLPNACVNFGTACHQAGEWGQAIEAYEKGLAFALSFGSAGDEVTIRYNLGKLYSDIGDFERAYLEAERAQELCTKTGRSAFVGAIQSLLGEIALVRGRPSEARAALDGALIEFAGKEAQREAYEVKLQIVLMHLAEGKVEAARRVCNELRLETPKAADLSTRTELTRALVFIASGEVSAALIDLEKCQKSRTALEQRMVRAEIELAFMDAYARQGSPFLAEQHRLKARELFERTSSTLSTPWQEVFWSHPQRVRIGDRTLSRDAPKEPASESRLSVKLRRVLDINRRLISSMNVRDVLEHTMDAAIELTGAERGFLILRSGSGALEVEVARNIDKERIGRSHLKFSRTVAERVIETGEPIVAVDAGTDERFHEHASVHAMRLKSVLCVPIHSGAETVGALYLDNRFRPGEFGETDMESLIAFANQASIALRNAQLHAELARKTAELEAERRRTQKLMRQQAERIDTLGEQLRVRQEALQHRYDYSQVIGRSDAMRRVFSALDRVIGTTVNVLVVGESGTGKELIARAIHFNGARREKPFTAVNCSAFAETLLEAELFGYKKGAFTGADRDHAGLLETARGGTLFLDELGEMPLSMQAKLLRVIQDGRYRPVGSTVESKTDVRLVCATNRDLVTAMADGRFRSDLYYRIAVVTIDLPPLSERKGDMPLLVHHLLETLAKRFERPIPAISADAIRVLESHTWPGNVRQLENVLAQAMLLARDERIDASDLQLDTPPSSSGATSSRREFVDDEMQRVHAALLANRWNVSAVSRILGIPRATLYYRMKQQGWIRGSM